MAGTGLLALLAKPGKGAMKKAPESSMDEESAAADPLEASVRDFFQAGKAGRYKEAATALREAYSHCEGGTESDEDEKEPDLDDL